MGDVLPSVNSRVNSLFEHLMTCWEIHGGSNVSHRSPACMRQKWPVKCRRKVQSCNEKPMMRQVCPQVHVIMLILSLYILFTTFYICSHVDNPMLKKIQYSKRNIISKSHV